MFIIQKYLTYLKKLVAEFFPEYPVLDENIARLDGSIRPLVLQNDEQAFSKSREHQIIQENGLYHVVGVKLTDFRRVAVELASLIPWQDLGVETNKHPHSDWVVLRKEGGHRMYAEDSPTAFVNQTMVLHWEDYVKRRRGLAPLLQSQMEPEKAKSEFQEIASILTLPEDEFHGLVGH